MSLSEWAVDEMPRSQILEQLKSHSNRSKGRLSAMMNLPIEVSAQGCEITALDKQTYLDCGGYGVFILGHRHPTVIEAVKRQLDNMCLSSRTLVSPELAIVSKQLADFSPAGLDYSFFTNSGAESVELALKLCRANGIKRIIALTGSYHGKTLGALSVTHREAFRTPFEPLMEDVQFIAINDQQALSQCFAQSQQPTAVILEPVQGEGGVQIVDAEFISLAQKLAKQSGGLLVVDEIQSGMARCGTHWAIEAAAVNPDIMLVGKGLSGGVVPCAAVVATEQAFTPLNQDFMLHSSTFGGSPIALAAASASIEVIQQQQIAKRAADLGEKIRQGLQPLCEQYDISYRGRGLLIGLDAHTPERAGKLTLKLLENKIVTSHSLSQATTVRLTPSAMLSDRHLDWLFTACHKALSTL